MHSLEGRAQKALDLIVTLEDAEDDQFKQLVMGQIGKELLAVLGWYVTAVFPDNLEQDTHDLVHLMIIAYFIKANELEPLFRHKDIQEQ